MTISEENRKAYVAALLEEKKGAEQNGNEQAVKEIDAELRASGYYRGKDKPRAPRKAPADTRGARKEPKKEEAKSEAPKGDK